MIVYVHQPEYFPWVGFFDKLSQCDLFVVLDNVQFERNSFQNRNRIRVPIGWRWLTVPVTRGFPQSICDVQISGSEWAKDHERLIEMHLSKAAHFGDYFQTIARLLSPRYRMLEDLTLDSITCAADILGIRVPILKSSTLKAQGSSQQLLINICKEVGADTYLAGTGGRNYMDEDEFERNAIKVKWHQYNHPIYQQVYPSFQSHMSVIDLILNEGRNSLGIVQSGGGTM